MRQLMKSIGAFAAFAVLAAGISEVAAHHSASMFDFSRTMTMKGSVVELRWVNPHVTLTLNGSVGEEPPAEWLMETTSPGNLVRVGGWRRDIVKPGDQVEVVFHPLREPDKKSGLMRQLTLLATGEVFAANIRDQEKPGLE
ncbi:MAG TPA: DUF6152 family protein [Bradyrhizobium sp.]|jgi:Family of unknown function (DUF6152)|nr:DUF6152 family protein [Bradyrhizobium sp.]